MKFDKTKILTCVTGGKEWIGKKGWFADSIVELRLKVNECSPHVLKVFDPSSVYPFRTEEGYPSALFYPAPEPSHVERQAEWVKENNVKGGTKVRFTKNFTNGEDGSGCCEHKYVKGMEGVVKYTEDDYLAVLVPYFGGLAVPFTALEVIKEPTYRPYNNDELNDLVGKVLTQKGCGYPCLVTQRYSMTQVYVNGHLYTARQLLELFALDGKPCGVKE